MEAVSPAISNVLADRPSISVHVYGGNIGAIRHSVFEPLTGQRKPFVSGYANATLPNLWDRARGLSCRR
ncbi:Cysteine dioxygenase (EC 1.13.11.20) [Azospirillum doebereinerae]